MTVHDGSEVVRAKVRKQVRKGNLPDDLKDKFAEGAANLAVSLIAQEDFARMMSRKLCRALPILTERKGMTATVEEEFREGMFFVLKFQIRHVDIVKAERAIREEKANSPTGDEDSLSFTSLLLKWSLCMIGPENKKCLEDYLFPRAIHDTVQSEMSAMMGENFNERRLQADFKILSEADQARYFFSQLKSVRKMIKKKRGVNFIDEWWKKIEDDLDRIDSDDSLF